MTVVMKYLHHNDDDLLKSDICNFILKAEDKNDDEDESSQRCMTLSYVTSAVPTIFPFSPFLTEFSMSKC